MAAPRVIVLRAPGTNCDVETAFAFEQAGADVQRVHINRLLESPTLTSQFQILCLPGGFSYGDDIAAGRILATQFRSHLSQALHEFREQGGLILGICNGFQVLIKSGILVPDQGGQPQASLTWNESGMYLDRWVQLETADTPCVFLEGVESMYLPIAHAEGKFVVRSQAVLKQLQESGQIAIRYGCLQPAGGSDTPTPIDNPNGSTDDVAGICDESGRVFGLMPHPERHLQRTQHPRWTRGEGREPGDGFVIFENAVRYFKA